LIFWAAHLDQGIKRKEGNEREECFCLSLRSLFTQPINGFGKDLGKEKVWEGGIKSSEVRGGRGLQLGISSFNN